MVSHQAHYVGYPLRATILIYIHSMKSLLSYSENRGSISFCIRELLKYLRTKKMCTL